MTEEQKGLLHDLCVALVTKGANSDFELGMVATLELLLEDRIQDFLNEIEEG
jgi:hypothetical protein